MKKSATILIVTGMLSSAFANAGDYYGDRARVLSASPILERINVPRSDCRTEYETRTIKEDRSYLGSIVGGLAGGLVGSRFGGGNGRLATTAIGAGVGAVVGDHIDNGDRGYSSERVPVERCATVDNWTTQTRGYNVTYEYEGRTYTTVTDRDPGPYIPVEVSVRPGRY